MTQAQQSIENKVIHLSEADFEKSVIQSKQPALVDFWADWCQPCHMLAPTVQALAEEYGDRILVGKVNVDDHPDLAARYGIRGIPALVFFKDGQRVHQLTGVRPKEAIARDIEQYL